MKKTTKKILKDTEEQAKAVEKALRSNGYLFPQSDDEIESLDKIIGSTETPLPKELEDTSFLFKKTENKKAKIIPLNPEPFNRLAYAASIDEDPAPSQLKKDIKKLKVNIAKKKKTKKK